MRRILHFILIGFIVLSAFVVLKSAKKEIGQSFPGYLSFENGVIGAYYVPGWPGPMQGLGYHDLASQASEVSRKNFDLGDYAAVVVVPVMSGVLFFLLGILAGNYLPEGRLESGGRWPLLFFHFLAGLYLILSPDFHLTHRWTYLHLAAFVFIPAAMLHFSLLFPEKLAMLLKQSRLQFLPYLLSAILLIPYTGLFFRYPRWWIESEYAVVFYVAASYLFWMFRLIRTFRSPQFESNRIIARYLLIGQLIAFAPLLAIALAVFIGRVPFPLNFAAPLTLFFPLSLFVGVVLARLQQSRMRLVETEKMAGLGNLMAGLAHELKNPLNFIVANLDALREKAASKDLREIADDMEEGAERMRAILEDARFYFSANTNEKKPVDLNEVARHAANILRHRCGDRIVLALQLGEIPKISGKASELGQAVLNLMANAVESIFGEGEVMVSTERRSHGVVLVICDTGGGIPPEILPKIFDPFFTTKAQGQGTGLGLAITQRIIHDHDGTIEVKSMSGKGTEVVVCFGLHVSREHVS